MSHSIFHRVQMPLSLLFQTFLFFHVKISATWKHENKTMLYDGSKIFGIQLSGSHRGIMLWLLWETFYRGAFFYSSVGILCCAYAPGGIEKKAGFCLPVPTPLPWSSPPAPFISQRILILLWTWNSIILSSVAWRFDTCTNAVNQKFHTCIYAFIWVGL